MSPKSLNILDALENLNTLIDADSIDEIEVTEEAQLIVHKSEEEKKEGYWIKAALDEQTLEAVKITFRSVYDYLQTFYTKMQKSGDTKRIVEGINTIMVLVGEAAKKLERFGSLFRERVPKIKEYKELQNFYRNKVIKETFREFAKVNQPKEELAPENVEWEKEIHDLLEQEEPIEEIAGQHLLNDIEVVKRDHLYELFYLKNEGGHYFYTYELARNLKVACDFGVYAEEYFIEDPLLQIKNWEDKALHIFAINLLKRTRASVEKFYKEALKYKEMDFIKNLHNACMALMLAANPRNMIRQFSLKGCHLYFSDFILFLREALNTREYQKLLIYSVPVNKPFLKDAINLIESLCYNFFTLGPDRNELNDSLKKIIFRFKDHTKKKLSAYLYHANYALTETLKKYPNGPVFKAVDLIREEVEESAFDPLFQGNYPEREIGIQNGEKEITLIRLPCPTRQQWINKAYPIQEFKTFLQSMGKNEHLLFIDFQDRTSWREHARCLAIEELSRQAEFADKLTTITLAKDTEFYNQTGMYEEMDDALEFIEHFWIHLKDEVTGYFFPPHLKSKLFPSFIKSLLKQIHETFFKKKHKLTYLERLDFIELAYHFIILKIIEEVEPTHLSLSSKDALDAGSTATIGFLSFITLFKKREWSEKERDKFTTILFGPTLMNRERPLHPERFDRLYALIEQLENSGDYFKSFSKLFNKNAGDWYTQATIK